MDLAGLNPVIQQIPLEFPQIRLVYLFGSQARGEATPQSDVDLAVLCPREEDQEIRARFQHQVCKALGNDRVDVVLLSRAPIDLAYNIISSGQLLFFADQIIRVEYESEVLSRYGDYLPVLRIFREQILEGGQHGRRIQRYRKTLERTQRALAETRASPDKKEE